MSAEEWRPVPGYESLYEVSSLGRARSLHRGAPRLLALGPHPGGYRVFHLYRDGVRTSTTLHVAVTLAFHGPRPSPDHEARHLDGHKPNCRADNLAWGTRAENAADMVAHGTRRRGEQMSQAKLTEAAVHAIRARAGEPQQRLADEFGCTYSNISAIILRKSWQHV